MLRKVLPGRTSPFWKAKPKNTKISNVFTGNLLLQISNMCIMYIYILQSYCIVCTFMCLYTIYAFIYLIYLCKHRKICTYLHIFTSIYIYISICLYSMDMFGTSSLFTVVWLLHAPSPHSHCNPCVRWPWGDLKLDHFVDNHSWRYSPMFRQTMTATTYHPKIFAIAIIAILTIKYID